VTLCLRCPQNGVRFLLVTNTKTSSFMRLLQRKLQNCTIRKVMGGDAVSHHVLTVVEEEEASTRGRDVSDGDLLVMRFSSTVVVENVDGRIVRMG